MTVNFNSTIAPTSVNTSTFIVESQGGISPGKYLIINTVGLNGESSSITFFPTRPLSLGAKYTISLTSGLTDISGYNSVIPFESTFYTQESYLIYFANNKGNGWSGNLLGAAIAANAPASVTNGVQGADYLCQQDSQCPSGSICHAMPVESTGTVRQAAPQQVGWVLLPSTPYMNMTESLIGVTNANESFDFPLTNAIFNLKGPKAIVWTGLNNDWTTPIVGTTECGSWTSSAAATGSANFGVVGSIDGRVISQGNRACQSSPTQPNLICVQQQ